jgi:hypothetical protein
MALEECFECADVTALLDRVKLRADTPCPDLETLTLIRLVLLSSLGSLIQQASRTWVDAMCGRIPVAAFTCHQCALVI